MAKETRSKKSRVRGLGGTPEEHRLRVPALLDRAERELRDAERSEQEGDCTRAVESLLVGRSVIGEAEGEARGSGDADARQDVRAFRQGWANTTAEIIRRCVRAKPVKEDPATRMRLRKRG